MNPIKFAMQRPIKALMLAVAVICGGVFGLYKMRVNIPALNTSRLYTSMDSAGIKVHEMKEHLVGQYEAYFHPHKEEAHHEHHKIVVTSPTLKAVTITQDYVCQIHSQRHINVKALEGGYLESIFVKEGQSVKKDDLMFKIVPTIYQAKLDAENAEARLAQLKLKNTKKLFDTKVVSQNEVFLLEAELAHAQAKAELANAELNFTNVKAPFDGIAGQLEQQLGSLIKEGETLTTLSDNSTMWVYFNVTEAQYLQYMAVLDKNKDLGRVELVLADNNKFSQVGKIDPSKGIGAIESKFNNTTGNIAFRADFPNPNGLLRHGQTGKVVVKHTVSDALVIPQRATFEILDKRYVDVLDKDDVVHQREIFIADTMDDIFVIRKGLSEGDKIVLEGMREIRDGEKVAYEYHSPEKVIAALKNKAE